jgi:two-component system chemotaxis sensor kinase CheA
MARSFRNPQVQWLPTAVAVFCAGVLALLLISGVRMASRLQSASTALQLASSMSTEPPLVRSQLTLIQRGLETRTYVGDSQRALAEGRSRANQAYAQLGRAIHSAGLDPDVEQLYGRARAHWQPLDAGLARIGATRSTDLYADSATGSALAPAGLRLRQEVNELLVAQGRDTATLTDDLARIAALVREAVVRYGQDLRALLLGGSALATGLLAVMLYFAWRARVAARAAGAAQRQIANILGTVREGLFLIDRDGRIGATHSDSLLGLLHTASPSGRSFDELLGELVDQKTLLAANKYLGLLWKDKVNEELIASVNPLGQIEVRFARAAGGAEQRYLSFSFRRARAAGGAADFVLCAVTDVTEQVLLQRELEQLRDQSGADSPLLLQLLQVDPLQLQLFHNNVDAGVRRCNALLRSPGSRPKELLAKLEGVFRELHSIKGEAAALGLDSFAERCHAAEDLLSAARDKPELAGDDFVPVVVKLDELFSHMQSVSEMLEQVGKVRSAVAATVDIPPEQHGDTAVLPPATGAAPAPAATAAAAGPRPAAASTTQRDAGLAGVLQRLGAEVATATGREVRVLAEGFDAVPAAHAQAVRAICIQMLRNSIAHGIEDAGTRAAAGKPPAGTVRLRFTGDASQGWSLLVEDDGQGLDPARIRERAIEAGLLGNNEAATLDANGAFRLIFQPGFSTAATVTEHAGRGVGLDLVSSTVRESGGRIGIATVPGKFTRFKITFPGAASEAQPSAA